MLETIREFGLEQLEATGEEMVIGRRHAAWCLALAEEATTQFFTTDEAAALARLETEHGNLRAALAWTAEQGDAATALRLTNALARFWYVQGRLQEGREWLERALTLDASGTTAPTVRARVLGWSQMLASYQGDYGPATARLEEALALFRALGDRPGVARAMSQFGGLAEFQGDDAQATVWYEAALALYRELGDTAWVGLMLENLADAAYRRGEYATAAALADEALTTSRAGGDAMIITQALAGVAQVACVDGDYGRAGAALQESLTLATAVGHQLGVADALAGCAALAAATAQMELATRLLGAADALCQTIGTLRVFHHAQHGRALAATQGSLEPATFAAAWDAGRALTAPQAVAEALAAIERILADQGPSAAKSEPPFDLALRP
jgi:tetratricopeptide (TPR) repeat protein